MTISVSTQEGLLRHNLDEIVAVWRAAPAETAFQVRDAVGRWFGRHRREVVSGLPSRMKRLVSRRGGGGSFFYTLYPTEREKQARRNVDLGRIYGRLRITSEVVLTHEFGATITPRSARALAVPVGKFRRMTTKRYREELRSGPRPFVKKRRRGTGAVLVRPTGTKTKTGKDRLETVAVLKREVRIEPTLGVMRTWDRLDGYRRRTLDEALGKAMQAAVRARGNGRVSA